MPFYAAQQLASGDVPQLSAAIQRGRARPAAIRHYQHRKRQGSWPSKSPHFFSGRRIPLPGRFVIGSRGHQSAVHGKRHAANRRCVGPKNGEFPVPWLHPIVGPLHHANQSALADRRD